MWASTRFWSVWRLERVSSSVRAARGAGQVGWHSALAGLAVGPQAEVGRGPHPHPKLEWRSHRPPAWCVCARRHRGAINRGRAPYPPRPIGVGPPPHPDTPRTACEAETPTSGCGWGGGGGVRWRGRGGKGLASRCSGAGRRRRTDSKERPQTRPNRQKRLPPHLTCCPESLPQKKQRKAAVPQLNSFAAADADGLLMGCGPPPTHTHPDTPRTACEAETPTSGCVWGGARFSLLGRGTPTPHGLKRAAPNASEPPKATFSPPYFMYGTPQTMHARSILKEHSTRPPPALLTLCTAQPKRCT